MFNPSTIEVVFISFVILGACSNIFSLYTQSKYRGQILPGLTKDVRRVTLGMLFTDPKWAIINGASYLVLFYLGWYTTMLLSVVIALPIALYCLFSLSAERTIKLNRKIFSEIEDSFRK